MGWWSLWVLFWVCFWVIDVLGLSVFRKCLAPSSGKSTAASRCLRGGKRPVRRHRASARCPCSCYRSLVCLSVFSGSIPHHIIPPRQPLTIGVSDVPPVLLGHRSSRRFRRCLLMPTARSSLCRYGVFGWGERSH